MVPELELWDLIYNGGTRFKMVGPKIELLEDPNLGTKNITLGSGYKCGLPKLELKNEILKCGTGTLTVGMEHEMLDRNYNCGTGTKNEGRN